MSPYFSCPCHLSEAETPPGPCVLSLGQARTWSQSQSRPKQSRQSRPDRQPAAAPGRVLAFLYTTQRHQPSITHDGNSIGGTHIPACWSLFLFSHYNILFPFSVSARVAVGFPRSPDLSAIRHMGRGETVTSRVLDKIRDTWGSLHFALDQLQLPFNFNQ